MPKKLNLGCGTDIREGWVNLDIVPLEGVDVVQDLEQFPYPFEDETFDEIVCQDILEHVDNLSGILIELKRILKPEGVLRIRVPHFSSRNNYADPTHRRMFSMHTFEFFIENAYDDRHYYFKDHYSGIDSVYISFAKSPLYFWNYLVEPLVNIQNRTRNFFEITGWSCLFPAENLFVVLRK